MAISVDWPSKVINIPQADLTPLGGGVYELDLNELRLTLKDLEDGEGMTFPDTHRHNTEVSVGGVTLARVIEFINGYTITFEDGQYAVNLVGANSNVSDVVNVNQVSVRSANSAGLVVSGSGVTSQDKADIADAVLESVVSGRGAGSLGSVAKVIQAILKNKTVTDPATGRMTVYDDDDVTPLFTADIFEDADGAQPYSGNGVERRETLS